LGALLADDMGLGKTVQALAWLQHLREMQGIGPCLVICPASVVFNWNREAVQFTPGLKVLLLTAGEHRHSLRQEIPQHDLVVTNYALLRRDLAALQKFAFRAIILDEAQNIKNPESMVARAAKALKAEHKLALTGTPLENRLLDLWSIMEFVHPGYLPERGKFLEQYDRGASQPARALLSSRMRPVMLRRLKKQVAQDLPDRIEERLDCELTEGQRKFYLAELQRSRQALSTLDPQAGPSRMHVLAALTRLRQICCHPSLAGGKKGLGSGKTSALFEVLEPLYAGGHKVLVFSQFVEMLKILKAELEERGRPYFMLTGQTTQRGEVVQAFHDCKEAAVFLLSLKAAGTGLNLTSASYVVLYDPWWNPAVEAQAIDRTHRIGQDRTVIAYRLVTVGTVEEKIWRLQQSKAQLAQDVLGEEGFTGSLSKTDFDYLLEDTSEELEPATGE
jgi:SNF2 family DNA or RNA helicase